jgi:hypothetical protein
MALLNEFDRASRRGKQVRAMLPHAISARYDRKSGRVIVDLSSRLTLNFSPQDAQGLQDAAPSQLEKIEVTPTGLGLHFPRLDADIYVPGLLEGLLGSRKWMAAKLGAAGGQSRSHAKKAASRANGKLGGRPRKASIQGV